MAATARSLQARSGVQAPLENELAKLGATHIVLAGASTNWCIRATAYRRSTAATT